MNLKERCRELNMSYQVVTKRISRGWDLEKALNTPRAFRPRERLFYKGKPLSELFSEEDIVILRKRVRKGMSVEDAVKTPIRHNKKTGLDRSKLTGKEYMDEYKKLRSQNV